MNWPNSIKSAIATHTAYCLHVTLWAVGAILNRREQEVITSYFNVGKTQMGDAFV